MVADGYVTAIGLVVGMVRQRREMRGHRWSWWSLLLLAAVVYSIFWLASY